MENGGVPAEMHGLLRSARTGFVKVDVSCQRANEWGGGPYDCCPTLHAHCCRRMYGAAAIRALPDLDHASFKQPNNDCHDQLHGSLQHMTQHTRTAAGGNVTVTQKKIWLQRFCPCNLTSCFIMHTTLQPSTPPGQLAPTHIQLYTILFILSPYNAREA